MALSLSIANSLDKGVKPLILWLNKHKYQTISSCSSHSARKLAQFSQAGQEKILSSNHQLNNPQSWILAKQNGYIIFKSKNDAKTIFNKIKHESKRLSPNNYEINFSTSSLNQKKINNQWNKVKKLVIQFS